MRIVKGFLFIILPMLIKNIIQVYESTEDSTTKRVDVEHKHIHLLKRVELIITSSTEVV